MKKIITLTIFILIIQYALAQTAYLNLNINTLNINNNISHSTVTSILYDTRGFVWLGTAFGLNKYNGHELKTYVHNPQQKLSIPSNYINFIIEDQQKTIWVSTMKGLVKYDRNTDNFHHILPDSILMVQTYAFTPSSILFGCSNHILQFDYETKKIDKVELGEDTILSTVVNICQWTKHKYLIIFNNGNSKIYDQTNNIVSQSNFQSIPERIRVAHTDTNQNLYIATERNGLYIFDKYGVQQQHITSLNTSLSHDIILDILEYNNQLWLATDGGGINIMDIEQPFNIHQLQKIPGNDNSIPSNSVLSLYKDMQNNIWGGTIKDGAFRMKEATIKTFKEVSDLNKYGLSNKTILSICEDKNGAIWIGTDGGGINRFDLNTQEFRHYPSTSNEKIVSLTNYSDDQLLFLSYAKGSYIFNKKTGKCAPFSFPENRQNSMYSFYRISEQQLLALGETPFIYDLKHNQIVELNKESKLNIAPSSRAFSNTDGTIYISNQNQLLSVDLSKLEVQLLKEFSSDEIVQVIFQDKDGLFWVGTDQGLRLFNKNTNSYQAIDTRLFHRVTGIIPDEDKLWIGAENMLFSYEKFSNKFTKHGNSDGFFANEIADIYLSSSTHPFLLIGGTHGLVQITKTKQPSKLVDPEISLSDITLNGASILNNKNEFELLNYTVPYNYNTLQIKVRATNQDIFSNNLFKYRIRKTTSLDKEEITTETYSPTLIANMLSPGKYYFDVSIYSNNGIWSEPKHILAITVTTPWYRDAKVICILIFFLLATLTIAYFFYAKKKEEKLKIKFLIKTSKELQSHITLIYTSLKKGIEKSSDSSLLVQKQTTENAHPNSVHYKQFAEFYYYIDKMNGTINRLLHANSNKNNLNVCQKDMDKMLFQQYYGPYLNITESNKKSINREDEEFLSRFNRLVFDYLGTTDIDIKFLTERLGMSRTPLYAKIKKLTDLGVNEYIVRLKIEKASELLTQTSLSIAEIAELSGFEYQKYLSTTFKKTKGISPSQFRQEHKNKNNSTD